MAKQTPLDVKSAVRTALAYLRDLDEFVSADEVRLEETVHEDDGDWLITLSTSELPIKGIAQQLELPRRSYKVFRIDAETGEVKSMKVRTLQPIE